MDEISILNDSYPQVDNEMHVEEKRGYFGIMIVILSEKEQSNDLFDKLHSAFVDDHAIFEKLSIIIINP